MSEKLSFWRSYRVGTAVRLLFAESAVFASIESFPAEQQQTDDHSGRTHQSGSQRFYAGQP